MPGVIILYFKARIFVIANNPLPNYEDYFYFKSICLFASVYLAVKCSLAAGSSLVHNGNLLKC